MAHYGPEKYSPHQYYEEEMYQYPESIEDVDSAHYFDPNNAYSGSLQSCSTSPLHNFPYTNHHASAPPRYASQTGYARDYLEDDDIAQFEEQTQTRTQLPAHLPYPPHQPLSQTYQAFPHTPQNTLRHLEPGTSSHGTYTTPTKYLYHTETTPSFPQNVHPEPLKRGADPRNAHGIQLKPVSILPDMYRSLFKFGVFNAIQSQCYDAIMSTADNMVISAPTGSGKTVLFELGLIRLLMERGTRDIKCVYMAPTKALCSERYRDWTAKLEPIGIKCCELTGDTVSFGRNAWGDAKSSSVIITTPEKFDSLSRNWRDHDNILSRAQLLLIDEVHILNESRGSTLEVVSSRMKSRGNSVRFMLVSATVPNIGDIAAWIGNGPSGGPARVFNFGDEFRPCKLARVVYGYPRKNQNEFSFNRTLDYKILPLLQQHAANKPVLIFCATRKGVMGTAEVLMKEYQKLSEGKQAVPWAQPRRIDASFHDSKLQELAAVGLGVHHAGLTLTDRRMTEDLFLKKVIRVVVATSTLAVGVNLPAHTVVVKGVEMWVNGGWQEYSDLDFIQMIGRAGRPQFDKEGVAVVLCDSNQERKYKALVSGHTPLESCLHVNLAEHLNSEIGLGTITDLATAKDWLHNSFLFQRIQKNPRHYALDKASDQTWQGRLDELVESSIDDLRKNELVTDNGDSGQFSSTEYGEIMSKYYIRLSTMGSLLKLPEKSTLREILELISNAEEIDLRFRAGEKQVFKKLSDHTDMRFPTKIDKAADKAVLGGISLNSPEYKTQDSQPFLEAMTVFKHAPRIARTIVDVAIAKKSGAVLKYAMELVRSLNARSWEDRPIVLRQIEQIGEKSIKVLAENGITTLARLRRESPGRIELLLNRRPPFGNGVLAAVSALPQFKLQITEASVSTFRGNKPVVVELNIHCSLIDAPDTQPGVARGKKKSGSSNLGMTTVLTLTSDNDFVDFRRIPTKSLREQKSFQVTVKLTKPSQIISTRISPDNFAGLTITETYKPSIDPKDYPTLDTRPASYDVDTVLEGLEEDPTFWDINPDDFSREDSAQARDTSPSLPPEPKGKAKAKTSSKVLAALNDQPKATLGTIRLPNGNYQCQHACKDKNKCRHFCCRDGLSKPPNQKKPSHSALTNPSPVSPAGRTSSVNKRKDSFVHLVRPEDAAKPRKKSNKAVAEDGLLHLETLHKKSSGLELPKGRRLKLASDPSLSTRKPNKQPEAWKMDLTFTDLDLEPVSKFSDIAQEDDDLPDPRDILSQPASNSCQLAPAPSSNYSDPDLDVFMANVPINLLKEEPSFPSSLQSKNPNPVSTQVVPKAKNTSTAMNARRRPRPRSPSLSPSPSPSQKRPRLNPRPVNPTMAGAVKSVEGSEALVYDPIAMKENLARDCGTKHENSMPLFTQEAFSDDEQAPAMMYNEDEPFAFDARTFDLEPMATPVSPVAVEDTREPIPNFPTGKECSENDIQSPRDVSNTYEPDALITMDSGQDGTVHSQQEGHVTTADEYDQAMAEFDEWFYSGAVEITENSA